MHYDITLPEKNILLALSTFHYLTVQQITNLLYAQGSLKSGVSPRMKSLYDRKYVDRKPIPRKSIAGSSEYLYWLNTLGRHYLTYAFGDAITFSTKYSYQMGRFVSSPHVDHCLEVTDFLIAASNMAQAIHSAQPGVSLRIERLLHDFTLHRMYNARVIPDGWIDFRMNEQEQYCLWLEVDRGTEKIAEFKKKLGNILIFIRSGDYERTFGTPAVTVAFITRERAGRALDMRKWGEDVLTKQQLTFEYDIFRFGSFPALTDPVSLFTSPLWEVPFQREKQPLFALL